MKYIEIKVKEIVPDPESEGCYRLILEDVAEGLELPMIISTLDARPLQNELEGGRSLRPDTHELFTRFIETTGYRIRRMNIHDFRRGVFYASLFFDQGNDHKNGFEADCRPTDGVALALQAGAPMYVSEEVMKQVGLLLSNDIGKMKAPQRLRVMEEKLRRLVQEERYEEAGILRDRINALKAGDA